MDGSCVKRVWERLRVIAMWMGAVWSALVRAVTHGMWMEAVRSEIRSESASVSRNECREMKGDEWEMCAINSPSWRYGPPRGYWCFGFEAFNKVMKRGAQMSNWTCTALAVMKHWSLRSARVLDKCV